jgi:hypothetical protein
MTLHSHVLHIYTYLEGVDDVATLGRLAEVCVAREMPEQPPLGPQTGRATGPEASRTFGGADERGIYQAIEYHSARLTAFLVCLAPAGPGRSWRELDDEWPEEPGDYVGRVRLYYALYDGDPAVEELDGSDHMAELFPGCHLWEVTGGDDHRRDRRFVLLAPASEEQRSDDWVWPGGGYQLPPIPGYLWEMAKIRHEGRRFEERRSSLPAQGLTGRAARFEDAERAGTLVGEERGQELRSLQRDTALASAAAAALSTMRRTVQAAADNAEAIAPGLSAADRAYVDWLLVEMADEAGTIEDAVRYAQPLAALATAAAEERQAALRERGQMLTLLQTAIIAAVGLVLAATQAIGYQWRTYKSVQTPFVIWVLFLGLFLPLVAATRPSGRYAGRWRGWVLVSGAGFAASTVSLAVAWIVRWHTGKPVAGSTFVITAVVFAVLAFLAWLVPVGKKRKVRR